MEEDAATEEEEEEEPPTLGIASRARPPRSPDAPTNLLTRDESVSC